MKLCHIPPAKAAWEVIPNTSTTHLCVANVVADSSDYASFYQERKHRGHFVIMDTAAFEGHDTPLSLLTKAARIVQPDEIVLSDVFQDPVQTVRKSYAAASHLWDVGYDSFMAVPQGRTGEEYFECARTLARIRGVKTFGVIEEVQELFGQPRGSIVSALKLMFPDKQIHLLGVSSTLTEMLDPWIRQNVRTMDTSKFVVWGLTGTMVSESWFRYGVPDYPGREKLGGRMGYFEWDELTPTSRDLVRNGISAMDNWLREDRF